MGMWKAPLDFVDAATLPNVRVDLRYASTNNFSGRNLYGDFRAAYLHPEAFAKFKRASEILASRRPGYKFLVYDALRPRSVQRQLFSIVKDTPQETYVANPHEGSVHNFGFALDLTITDEEGRALDMGAEFDQFDALSEPRYEAQFLMEGKLTHAQIENRQLLRTVMEEAGFSAIVDEWWHFDAVPAEVLRQSYPIIE